MSRLGAKRGRLEIIEEEEEVIASGTSSCSIAASTPSTPTVTRTPEQPPPLKRQRTTSVDQLPVVRPVPGPSSKPSTSVTSPEYQFCIRTEGDNIILKINDIAHSFYSKKCDVLNIGKKYYITGLSDEISKGIYIITSNRLTEDILNIKIHHIKDDESVILPINCQGNSTDEYTAYISYIVQYIQSTK